MEPFNYANENSWNEIKSKRIKRCRKEKFTWFRSAYRFYSFDTETLSLEIQVICSKHPPLIVSKIPIFISDTNTVSSPMLRCLVWYGRNKTTAADEREALMFYSLILCVRREVFDVENYSEHTHTHRRALNANSTHIKVYSIENKCLNIYRKFYKSKLCAGERVDAESFATDVEVLVEIQLQKQNNNGNLRKVLRIRF